MAEALKKRSRSRRYMDSPQREPRLSLFTRGRRPCEGSSSSDTTA
jgi:hypothetical protein